MPLRVLGIETSCDETAAAIVDSERQILANIVHSQLAEHAPYGGVVPEIAARAHIDHLDGLIMQALRQARMGFSDLDGIAVTGGPGLIGGVIVGVMTAKAIASVHRKPFIAVNHLEGHALTVRLTNHVDYPYLLLLVSGGHCQLLIVSGVGRYRLLGATMDDAVGEAFDKTAKMLGLGYPGGPQVEAFARRGNAAAYAFPRPLLGRQDCNFSFSGLKTAVRLRLNGMGEITEKIREDICASFQAAVGDVLVDRVDNAIAEFRRDYPAGGALVVAGGVAANHYLRGCLQRLADEHGLPFTAPPVNLCTDNAAMIAWAGLERLQSGQVDALDFEPRARWPLVG